MVLTDVTPSIASASVKFIYGIVVSFFVDSVREQQIWIVAHIPLLPTGEPRAGFTLFPPVTPGLPKLPLTRKTNAVFSLSFRTETELSVARYRHTKPSFRNLRQGHATTDRLYVNKSRVSHHL